LAGGLGGFVGLLSLDGSLLDADRGAFEAADLSVEEAVGRPFWDTACWSWSRSVQDRLRTAVGRAAAGDAIRYDETIRVRGNRLITIDVGLVPRIEAGVVVALVCSAVDMTERQSAL
jgi:PAS domain-containing protein